jgi:3-deoxy-manno-octulosonate cytidylyltransferase (CMP-KDO synthetase)
MSAVVIIPSRFASTRFPGKPLAMLLGQPMIAWVVRRCLQAAVGPVLVACDHQEIAAAAARAGAEVFLTAADHPNGSSRIAEVARQRKEEFIINVQGDEPAIAPAALKSVLELLSQPDEPEMATLAEPLQPGDDPGNANLVKVVCTSRGDALYFSRAAIPHRHPSAPSDLAVPYLRHLGIYGYRRPFLNAYANEPPQALEQVEGLEQLRALAMGARIRVGIHRFPSIGVDVPADLERAEALLIAMGEKP